MIAGGNTLLPGFRDRLELELESLKPQEAKVRVFELQNPTQAAWRGLKSFCSNKHTFEEYVVTRKEYHEDGGLRALKKFNF